mgnify:CR=1 FL=1
MPQEPTVATSLQPNRPLFLTVLCILGFLGSITSIITNGIGFYRSDAEVVQIKSGTEKTQLKNLFSFGKTAANEPLEISNLTPENFEKYSIGGIVAGFLCLIGVILMWLHKKSGFYSFVLGTFFNIITHFLLFGDNIGAMGISMLWALIGLVLVVLFSKFLNNMD